MARILAALFFILALTRGYFDWQLSKLNETVFTFQPIGQVWFDFDRNSLLGLQPGIERYLSPVIWENAVGPMLLWPMALALLGVSVFFVLWAIIARFRRS
ncbi:MAG: hypothetical protein L3J37_09355 [Rhodobacteraceae bacterium]|nr:hypothetical protein [Paracoccaceae bacterium]